jgi:hypothetical protein
MQRKYLLFHTARAAIFVFYASLMPFIILVHAMLSQEAPKGNTIGGLILYMGFILIAAASIDRPKRGLTQ